MAVLACREYVTTQASQSEQATMELGQALARELRQWLADKRIVGFRSHNLYSVEDIENEGLDEGSILETTGNVFPAIFVNVTFDAATFDRRTLEPLERQYGLQLLL